MFKEDFFEDGKLSDLTYRELGVYLKLVALASNKGLVHRQHTMPRIAYSNSELMKLIGITDKLVFKKIIESLAEKKVIYILKNKMILITGYQYDNSIRRNKEE